MRILLGCPRTGTVMWQSARSAWRSSEQHTIEVADLDGTLLAQQFNALYAEALNRQEAGDGITHFAMLHGDLAADGFWIDTLFRIMEERGADLVSAVNAIKDDRALTSSGLGVPGFPWHPWRRFTMRELVNWPATFNAADIGFPDHVLLHNSGCWLADLRNPIFHEEDEDGQLRAYFTIKDRIVRRRGKWRPEVESEDWFFSRRLHELGANTYATREVVTHHYGFCDCDNQTERGTRPTDTDLRNEWTEIMREACNADS